MKKLTLFLLLITLCMQSFPQHIYAQNRAFETPSGMNETELENLCDKALEPSIGKTIGGAVIVVMKDGKIAFEKSYGYADMEQKKPIDPATTIFEYGSVTKLFTWTSAMQLAENGELDLNKDIRTYLPDDFKLDTKYEKPITMLHLMNHTAGFDDYLIGLFCQKEHIPDLRTALYENQVQQVAEPGFALSYSNYGAALAGFLVECISSESMDDYVEKHIFTKCGMTHTTIKPDIVNNEIIQKNKSLAYTVDSDGNLAESGWSYVPAYPAGSANGTVEDLAKFGTALCEESSEPKLFKNKEGIKKLFATTYQGASDVAGVSHGFFQYSGEYPTYWHNGSTENFSSFFAVVPEAGYTIAILSNTDSDYAMDTIQTLGFQTVQKKNICIDTKEESLPDTKLVEGKYRDFRQVHRGITQLIYLFPGTLQVKAINDTQIKMNGSVFTQIRPYIYQDIETGEKGAFTVLDGKVVKYSNIIDYVKVPFQDFVWEYLTYAILFLFLLSNLIILPYEVYRFIRLLMRKENFNQAMLFSCLSTIGFLVLTVNCFVVFEKITIWQRFYTLKGNLYFNGLLGIFIIICSFLSIRANRKSTRKMQKILGITYSTISVLTVITLLFWGVFNFIR